MPRTKKTSLMRQIERRYPGQPIQEIATAALNRCGTIEAAAQDLGVSYDTLRDWMKEWGIVLRTVAEVQSPQPA